MASAGDSFVISSNSLITGDRRQLMGRERPFLSTSKSCWLATTDDGIDKMNEHYIKTMRQS